MKTATLISIKRAGLILLLTLLCLGCLGPAQQLTPSDLSITRPDADSIVIVHSRTGNTAHMGRLIAEAIHADYIRLDVPAGSQDSITSIIDRHEDMQIHPREVNLDKYRLVFLGSPIWFMHPTPFIYTFIKNNDFSAKSVVLFYTYGGTIADDAIDEWKELVRQSGGTVFDVIGIDRSVFKTREALEAEMNATIDRQKSLWLEGNL